MRKRKPSLENAACAPGSPEQQLDMCESGTLRGDEQLREASTEHPLFQIDMAEEGREGDEMSGDEHSAGLQGEDSEFADQETEEGMPGDETRLEDLRARRRHLPEEPEPTRAAQLERVRELRRKTGSS